MFDAYASYFRRVCVGKFGQGTVVAQSTAPETNRWRIHPRIPPWSFVVTLALLTVATYRPGSLDSKLETRHLALSFQETSWVRNESFVNTKSKSLFHFVDAASIESLCVVHALENFSVDIRSSVSLCGMLLDFIDCRLGVGGEVLSCRNCRSLSLWMSTTVR